ncbi:MAG: methionyl-tRNA formyltransferase [Hyphomicrobiaceae bacterium]|nr:MAG: methionyl-tRNA formyltransferase [Hyphomicrobiaceae bacterium]
MLRIVFMGTPEFAVPTLAGIVAAGHRVAAVYTQPPRPAGRGMAERKSAVHAFAEGAGLPVLTPRSLKGADAQAAFVAHGADVGVVVAYGLILPRAVLAGPRQGCLNLHASALPRWRGAAPIQRAVMAGDAETAATVMRMDEGLDTGPVCLSEPVAIGSDMTAGELHDVMAESGAKLMVRALAELERGCLACVPQPVDGVTYAAKVGKDESRIDFGRPASEVHNHIRGLSPFPGAWFETSMGGKPERIKVLRTTLSGGAGAPGSVLDDALTVACAEGAVRILEVQRAGKRPMTAGEFLRGFPLKRGTQL